MEQTTQHESAASSTAVAVPAPTLSASEQEALVTKWLPLAYKLAATERKRWGGSLADLRQEAALALVVAAKNYNPLKASFGTLAHPAIRGHFGRLREARGQNGSRRPAKRSSLPNGNHPLSLDQVKSDDLI